MFIFKSCRVGLIQTPVKLKRVKAMFMIVVLFLISLHLCYQYVSLRVCVCVRGCVCVCSNKTHRKVTVVRFASAASTSIWLSSTLLLSNSISSVMNPIMSTEPANVHVNIPADLNSLKVLVCEHNGRSEWCHFNKRLSWVNQPRTQRLASRTCRQSLDPAAGWEGQNRQQTGEEKKKKRGPHPGQDKQTRKPETPARQKHIRTHIRTPATHQDSAPMGWGCGLYARGRGRGNKTQVTHQSVRWGDRDRWDQDRQEKDRDAKIMGCTVVTSHLLFMKDLDGSRKKRPSSENTDNLKESKAVTQHLFSH